MFCRGVRMCALSLLPKLFARSGGAKTLLSMQGRDKLYTGEEVRRLSLKSFCLGRGDSGGAKPNCLALASIAPVGGLPLLHRRGCDVFSEEAMTVVFGCIDADGMNNSREGNRRADGQLLRLRCRTNIPDLQSIGERTEEQPKLGAQSLPGLGEFDEDATPNRGCVLMRASFSLTAPGKGNGGGRGRRRGDALWTLRGCGSLGSTTALLRWPQPTP